jgi:TetR/AcrR family transcriptional regulator, transcriptional repressor for nem operon
LRITTQQREENRARIVAVASKLFRENGFDGIGLAELMNNAGMTHGGFYNHFGSKEELESAACDLAFETAIARISAATKETQEARRSAYVGHVADYLSPRARDAAGGCPMVSLGSEVFKRGTQLRRSFASGVSRYIDAISALISRPRRNRAQSREDAIVALALLVGGLLLARTVKEHSLKESDEILTVVKNALYAASS